MKLGEYIKHLQELKKEHSMENKLVDGIEWSRFDNRKDYKKFLESNKNLNGGRYWNSIDYYVKCFITNDWYSIWCGYTESTNGLFLVPISLSKHIEVKSIDYKLGKFYEIDHRKYEVVQTINKDGEEKYYLEDNMHAVYGGYSTLEELKNTNLDEPRGGMFGSILSELILS